MGTQKSQWDGSFEHPTHKLCSNWWIRKYLQFYAQKFCLSKPMICMGLIAARNLKKTCLFGFWSSQTWTSLYFSRTPDRDFRCFYPCEMFLTHTSVPALGKDKKGTAAHWLHVDPWRRCNVKMTSPCRISVYSGFSGSLFHVFSINEV